MADLRAIAEAATPGPWRTGVGKFGVDALVAEHRGHRRGQLLLAEVYPDNRASLILAESHADAAHIAAWSPDRALAALDVIEAAGGVFNREPGLDSQRAIQRLREALARWEALP